MSLRQNYIHEKGETQKQWVAAETENYVTGFTPTFFSPNSSMSNISLHISNNQNFYNIITDCNKNEAFVYWYFGSHGLKQGAIDYYRDALTQNILHGAIPFLVDLTAWASFTKVGQWNRYHESAKSLESDNIKTLICSEFFEALQKIKPDDKVFTLINDIVKRENLLKPSVNFSEVGFTLGDLFQHNCPAIQAIYSLDCAKSYSVIQYVEFLFLVEMILTKKPDIQTIKFVLPNDEAKYYSLSLVHDLQTFLKAKDCVFDKLNISIQCFNYGEQMFHRPYNCPSKTIPAKKKLLLSQIIDEKALNQMSSAAIERNRKICAGK